MVNWKLMPTLLVPFGQVGDDTLVNGGDAGGLFIRQGQSETWINADNHLTLTHGATWKLTLADGGELDLGETLEDGDYGIRRLDLPVPPAIDGRSIVGDRAALDNNPEQPGLQLSYDDLMNVRTDPDQPEEGRSDGLLDSYQSDRLQGKAGCDQLSAQRGGIDILIDDDTGPDKSVLVFGTGIDAAGIKLRKGSLMLDLGDGDAVHIQNFNADDPLANASVEAFQFADGTVLGWNELLARGFDLDGTAGADDVTGTGVADRIAGYGGNDLAMFSSRKASSEGTANDAWWRMAA